MLPSWMISLPTDRAASSCAACNGDACRGNKVKMGLMEATRRSDGLAIWCNSFQLRLGLGLGHGSLNSRRWAPCKTARNNRTKKVRRMSRHYIPPLALSERYSAQYSRGRRDDQNKEIP
jgi:hypothetical protein